MINSPTCPPWCTADHKNGPDTDQGRLSTLHTSDYGPVVVEQRELHEPGEYGPVLVNVLDSDLWLTPDEAAALSAAIRSAATMARNVRRGARRVHDLHVHGCVRPSDHSGACLRSESDR